MKQILLVLALTTVFLSTAQSIALKKGVITDAIKVNDSIAESFALYLPSNFEMTKKWPVIFLFDMKGKGRQMLGMFKTAAEEQGYVLAASNSISDSLSLSKNVLICSRMFNAVYNILPIKKNRTYTSGFSSGARFASLVPTFVKNIEGVLSIGSSVSNIDMLSSKKKFHFIGIVGNADYNFPEMLKLEKLLGKLGFKNQLLVFEGNHQWPPKDYLSKAMEIFNLASMAKGDKPKKTEYIENAYKSNLEEVDVLFASGKALLANKSIANMIKIFGPYKNIDSLKANRKIIKRSKLFRTQNRNQNAILFKESLIKEDYTYYLEEDIITYNFNNLGWWKYQMTELEKYDKSVNVFEKQMGSRLRGYINALVEDNIDLLKAEPTIDLEALNFLYMLKTIIAPKNYKGYLEVISNSARMEDYGTAFFYLEELLKNGFKNRAALYELEHAALLRIMPEFNEIIEKYMKSAPHKTKEE